MKHIQLFEDWITIDIITSTLSQNIQMSNKLRRVLTEQTSNTIKITSTNYSQLNDLMSTHCKVLRFNKSDGDYLISKNKELYNTILEKRLIELQESLKDIKLEGFKNDNPVVNKFVSSIINEDIKKDIRAEMNRYYSQLIYAYIGLNKPIDINLIISNIDNIMVNGILKQYESSFVLKNLGKAFINKDNIEVIKRAAFEAIKNLLWAIEDFVTMTFDDFINSNVITSYAREKEKTTPICDKIIITVDKFYNSVQPYSPRQKYKDFEYTTQLTQKTNKLFVGFLPKINSVLDSLI